MQQPIALQGEKKYSTKEFSVLTGIARRTLVLWSSKGKLIPDESNGKGKASYYSAAQIEVAKKLFRSRSTAEANSNIIGLFSEQANEQVNEQVSEDNREVWELIPNVDDLKDTDDELIYTSNDDAREIDSPVEVTPDTNADIDSAKSVMSTAADEDRREPTATPKNFLPMTITPNFDAIPQKLKDLRRWLCWQLQPANPKPKKVPMSPKNGRLVNASVTDPNNWLTFDEAISYFNRGLCTGIGFALTNTPPKVCCVDVDHCFNPDNALTDEAKAVMETCEDSFTEKSQSGTGIHCWFIDDEFDGGRRKGNVEVYANDRYIAMTGVRVQSSSKELKTVNGACRKVIEKFIGDRGGNLFDKTTPTTNEEIKLPDAMNFETAAPMTDDDRRLIRYFLSGKCRERDSSLFELFSGDKESYFKRIGKPFDDSVADCDLMLKILFYVGGEGRDADIGHRVLKIFGQSELAKREKWQREDYRLRTLKAAFDIWNKNGRKAAIKTASLDDDPIAALKSELREVNKSIADFDAEKDAALEKLRNVETFDSDTVFSEEVMTAAAFARFADKKTFSDFRGEITLYNRKTKDKKVSVNDWLADVKDRAAEIGNRKADLITRRNEIQSEIDSLSFVGNHDALKNFVIPHGYSVSDKYGIKKIEGEKSIPVCLRPVIITGRTYSVDEKIFKTNLAYMTAAGKWETISPTEAAIVFNKAKIVDLANSGLPVTSTNAALIVDYLYNFQGSNESTLPLTKCVNRCGWYNFGGKDFFIDPRRDCVIHEEDKIFSVTVDKARSEFSTHLKQVGDIEAWKEIYKLAKKSPVARLIVSAAVAPLLLKVLGERNFLLYIYAPTRAGKTTALYLAASAVGDEKMIRSFDATKNGLAGAAADVNDYAFLVDEKQVADSKLKEQIDTLVYALANGLGRTKLNKDSTLKKTQDWRTIAVMTGETQMLSDNVTGGANTRLLTIKAPKEILAPDTCKIIRDTIKENYGLALPLVIDKVLEIGRYKLREMFSGMIDTFAAQFPEILSEYRRYMAVLSLADALLNAALFGNTATAPDGKTIKASDDAIINAAKIFPIIPTTAEIADTPREKDFVRGIIAKNQNRFIGGNVELERMQDVLGKLNDPDGFNYIAAKFLQDACRNDGFDYHKLVDDLVADGFFTPDDTIKKGRKTPLATVQKRIGEVNTRCYRIRRVVFDTDE